MGQGEMCAPPCMFCLLVFAVSGETMVNSTVKFSSECGLFSLVEFQVHPLQGGSGSNIAMRRTMLSLFFTTLSSGSVEYSLKILQIFKHISTDQWRSDCCNELCKLNLLTRHPWKSQNAWMIDGKSSEILYCRKTDLHSNGFSALCVLALVSGSRNVMLLKHGRKKQRRTSRTSRSRSKSWNRSWWEKQHGRHSEEAILIGEVRWKMSGYCRKHTISWSWNGLFMSCVYSARCQVVGLAESQSAILCSIRALSCWKTCLFRRKVWLGYSCVSSRRKHTWYYIAVCNVVLLIYCRKKTIPLILCMRLDHAIDGLDKENYCAKGTR